jgi:hypothetical protein
MPRGRAGTRDPRGSAPEAHTVRTGRRYPRAPGLGLRLVRGEPAPVRNSVPLTEVWGPPPGVSGTKNGNNISVG